MSNLLNFVNEQISAEAKAKIPQFTSGDTVNVHVKIKEGNKERIQQYQGVVVQIRNSGHAGETFTVRKISNGVGVERIFPVASPSIEKVEVVRRGKVRRARLFYLREAKGKQARIKEKIAK
jgi:large subunit ribosomal protein L19